MAIKHVMSRVNMRKIGIAMAERQRDQVPGCDTSANPTGRAEDGALSSQCECKTLFSRAGRSPRAALPEQSAVRWRPAARASRE